MAKSYEEIPFGQNPIGESFWAKSYRKIPFGQNPIGFPSVFPCGPGLLAADGGWRAVAEKVGGGGESVSESSAQAGCLSWLGE